MQSHALRQAMAMTAHRAQSTAKPCQPCHARHSPPSPAGERSAAGSLPQPQLTAHLGSAPVRSCTCWRGRSGPGRSEPREGGAPALALCGSTAAGGPPLRSSSGAPPSSWPVLLGPRACLCPLAKGMSLQVAKRRSGPCVDQGPPGGEAKCGSDAAEGLGYPAPSLAAFSSPSSSFLMAGPFLLLCLSYGASTMCSKKGPSVAQPWTLMGPAMHCRTGQARGAAGDWSRYRDMRGLAEPTGAEQRAWQQSIMEPLLPPRACPAPDPPCSPFPHPPPSPAYCPRSSASGSAAVRSIGQGPRRTPASAHKQCTPWRRAHRREQAATRPSLCSSHS